MVRVPSHLFNQEITVIESFSNFDVFGEEIFGSTVVDFGQARLEVIDERVLTDDGIVIDTVIRAFVEPDIDVENGYKVVIGSQEFRVVKVIDRVDGRGRTRFKVLSLQEVQE